MFKKGWIEQKLWINLKILGNFETIRKLKKITLEFDWRKLKIILSKK